jgi:hypothetical protein
MEQIEEAYVFIKNVFTDNADEILRKVYVLPPDNTVPVPKGTQKPAKQAAGWIQHPCPRNIVRKIVK